MQNELDLPDEMVREGLALRRLTADEEVWPALQRLLRDMNAGAISLWESDDKDGKYGKKWLRGYRQCLVDLAARIEEKAKLSENHVEAKKLTADAARSMVDEGMGAGDIAIA